MKYDFREFKDSITLSGTSGSFTITSAGGIGGFTRGLIHQLIVEPDNDVTFDVRIVNHLGEVIHNTYTNKYVNEIPNLGVQIAFTVYIENVSASNESFDYYVNVRRR